MSLARDLPKSRVTVDFFAGFATGLVAGVLLVLALVAYYQEVLR